MHVAPIRRIVILGGGSAGWMAAALLARLLDRSYSITLVESEAIGTVGVGEATIPPIKQFNALLGLDESEFLRATRGTFKLGIGFDGWGRADSRYFHGFGPIGQNLGWLRCHQYWLRQRAAGAALPIDDYVMTSTAAAAGRFAKPSGGGRSPLNDITYAYQFDAARYAALLRRFAEARQVERVEGRVEEVVLHPESGRIEALALASGARIEGDFFLDCSGFRALLIQEALRSGWEDWSRWLPCDRAIALATEALDPLPPSTLSIAHAAGWQWRIPLQHRTGNGIVYTSAAMSDEEAHAHLLRHAAGAATAEPRPLRFRTGRRNAAWVGNCVAIGLSAGFLEPLESTSLHFVQTALLRLIALFPDGGFDPAAIAEYNRQTVIEAEHARDFLIAHYKLNAREETFWRDRAAMEVPASLARRLALFAGRGHVFREEDELFAPESWFQLFLGQGLVPAAPDPLTALESDERVRGYLANIAETIRRCVATMPAHDAFIAAHCAAPNSCEELS
ncbi:MAG: tryptophan halogenase family protein [Sphingomonas sp.]